MKPRATCALSACFLPTALGGATDGRHRRRAFPSSRAEDEAKDRGILTGGRPIGYNDFWSATTKETGGREVKKDLINLVKTTGNKYAVALSANANHGKTSILKKLADAFRANKAATLVDVSPMQSPNDEMWCFEMDGVRICVVTGGDDGSAVDAGFNFAVKNGCQILFCATRYYSNSPSWNEFLARCQNDGYIDDWQKVNEYSDATLNVMHSDIAQNVLLKML